MIAARESGALPDRDEWRAGSRGRLRLLRRLERSALVETTTRSGRPGRLSRRPTARLSVLVDPCSVFVMSLDLPVLDSIVGGESRPGPGSAEDMNPARPSESVAHVRLADVTVALEAVAAAAEAAPGWRRTVAPERGAILRRAGDLLEARAGEIGRDLAREEGKTLAEGIGETQRAAAIFRYFAGQTLEPDGETYPSHSAATFLYAAGAARCRHHDHAMELPDRDSRPGRSLRRSPSGTRSAGSPPRSYRSPRCTSTAP